MMSDTMMSDMSDIAAGAIVTCPRATAAQLWVVVRSAPGGSWHCRAKRVDERGRSDTTSRICGPGDLVLVRPAPIYEPNTMIVYGGRYHEASRDLGDAVELIVPDVRLPLHGGSTRPRGERNSAWATVSRGKPNEDRAQ